MAAVRRPHDRARKRAREVLWECGLDEPAKIDPLLIVGRVGIAVIYGPLDGPTAQIFRHGARAIMRVSDSIIQIGRRHFTIAHELGHYLLGHRIPEGDNLTPTARTPSHERDADVFATELLMPEEWVAPLVAMSPSLAAVRTIGETFRTSIVASARRFVELTAAPCALVYSEAGYVVWAKHSRSFPGRIAKQSRIGRGTIAADFHTSRVLDARARTVPATAWFGAASTPGACASLVEHAEVVPEPGWGGVLSLLAA